MWNLEKVLEFMSNFFFEMFLKTVQIPERFAVKLRSDLMQKY